MLRDLIRKTHQRIKAFKGKVDEMKHTRSVEEEKFREYSPSEEKPKVQTTRLEIPSSVIMKVFFIALLFIAGVLFLNEIRAIILIFFVSLLFAAALDPMVDWMEHRKIPRAIGVIIIYILIFLVLGIFVGNLIPLVANELKDLALKTQDLITNIVNGNIQLPGFLEWLRPTIQKVFEGVDISKIADYQEFLIKSADKLTSVGKNVFNVVVSIFNGLLNTILVFVLTFLMTVDERGIDKFILALFPTKYAKYITEKSNAVKEKIGHWLRGQVALMVVVGIAVYLGFFVIGLFGTKVQYATTLAMFAGLTEIIPVVGPVLAWLISLPIVANQSLTLLIWVTLVYIIVQQLENNLIVPVVMNKAVGLSPILIIVAVLIGYEFLGILGMVIAIPVATTVAIFVKDYASKEKQ